ncbi:uncharacterized protein RCO7_11275 [Rhynchosporium graminicola]|uniref:2EXR domain-containing protein n=1 Tax=Rhynchosporium graminicola TaxID=2792576 RepID=A0A1E1LSL5_9HELO|nr:uncharacterized protein RCO7_11275 [Rhynchosporium commune]
MDTQTSGSGGAASSPTVQSSKGKTLTINPAAATRNDVATSPPYVLSDNLSNFQKLSMEVQLMIWKFSIGPRKIEMRFYNNFNSTQFDIVADIPAVLHINQEVRAEFLKFYKLLFTHEKGRAPAYFDNKIDILHIRHTVRGNAGYWQEVDLRQMFRTIRSLPDKSEIRHLSTGWTFWCLGSMYLQFSNLETASVVINNSQTNPCDHASPDTLQIQPDSAHIIPLQHPLDCLQTLTHKNISFMVRKSLAKIGRLEDAGDIPLWKRPVFSYNTLCLESIRQKKMFCPGFSRSRARKTKSKVLANTHAAVLRSQGRGSKGMTCKGVPMVKKLAGC